MKSSRIKTISTSPGRIEIDLLNSLNKKLIQKFDFSEIEDRLKNIDSRIDRNFWETTRGNLDIVEDIKGWGDIVFDSSPIEPADKEFIKIALDLMPEEPWNDTTWDNWTAKIKEKTGRKGKDLFLL